METLEVLSDGRKALAIEVEWSYIDYQEARRVLWRTKKKFQHLKRAEAQLFGLTAKKYAKRKDSKTKGVSS